MTSSFTGEGLVGTRVDPENPVISLVIPTYNESANIVELLARLTAALPAQVPCEVIFVDDSTDDTPAVIIEAARSSSLAVSLPISGQICRRVEGELRRRATIPASSNGAQDQ